MAVACSSMEVHDRRLSVSKASASKISKPSQSPSLKILAASASGASTSPSASSSPPCQLPSSITASPSRPIAKVVNADPSSFRRVVQELTGTTSSSPASSTGASPRGPSRLQRIAPPPLRTAVRSSSLSDCPGLPQQPTLLDQMQHNRASQMLLLQPHIQKVGPLSTSSSFPEVPNSMSNPTFHLGNTSAYSGSEQFLLLENPNPNFSQGLPILSPHLLSPLPVLTPRDSSWANPIEMASPSPKLMASASNSLPSVLSLPISTTSDANNFHFDGSLSKPAYATREAFDAVSNLPQVSQMITSAVSTYEQSLSALFTAPLQSIAFHGVLPPWSPSPLPFSPGILPLSPSPGPLPATASPIVDGSQFTGHIKHGSSDAAMPNSFTF